MLKDDLPPHPNEALPKGNIAVLLLVNSSKTDPVSLLEEIDDRKLVVITEAKYLSLYRSGTEVHLVSNLTDLNDVRRAGMAAAATAKPSAVITPSERTILPGAYLRKALGISGMDLDTAIAVTNKYVMKQRLSRAGIPVTEFGLLSHFRDLPQVAERVGWPIVIKPLEGRGSVGVKRVNNEAHFSSEILCDEPSGRTEVGCPLIIERWVDIEEEYHCDGVVWEGESLFVCPSRYFEPVLGHRELIGSYTLPTDHSMYGCLVELHQRVVSALGIKAAVTHLEAYRVGGRLLVGEIAARPGGGGIVDMVQMHSGINLWKAFLDVSVERTPDLTVQHSPGIGAQCILPIQNGRVAAVPDWDHVRSLPDVVKLVPMVDVGDVIEGPIYSSQGAAVVQFRVPGVEAVFPAAARVAKSSIITLAPY